MHAIGATRRYSFRPGLIRGAIGLMAMGLLSTARLEAVSTWIGGTGNFYDAADWSTGLAPDGTDTVVVANGGTVQVTNFAATAATTVDQSSTIDVFAGPTSKLGAVGTLVVGLTGLGTITIGNQAIVITNELESNNSYLGFESGAEGVIRGTGGTFSTSDLYVGFGGNGTMDFRSGSQVFSNTSSLGFSPGSVGKVMLQDSTWNVVGTLVGWDNLTVGTGGRGELTAGNSQVRLENLTIADAAVGNGTVALTGGNLTATETVFVGFNGTASFQSTNATVQARELFVGRNAGSTGVATISGGSLTLSADLHVGADGTGTFTLENGGTMSSDIANVGFGGTGVLNITSGNFTNTRGIFVGVSGNGTLNIGPNGTVNSESGFLAQSESGVGTAVLTGGRWTMSNSLVIGVNGTATLTATDGAQISSVWGQIGLNAGSSGAATLGNASWTLAQALTIGVSGHGSLSLTDGTTLAARTITVANSSGINGSLSVSDSTVITGNILAGSGNATVSFSGATLQLPTNVQVVDTLLINGFPGVLIGSGGLTVDTAGGNAQIASSLGGNGSLTKTGTGRLRLNTANTYSGGTTVNGGALEVTSAESLGTGAVVVNTAELRSTANVTLSNSIPSVSIPANQSATFSATDGNTFTLSPAQFSIGENASLTSGSAGHTGTVVFAPDNISLASFPGSVTVAAGRLHAGNSALEQMTASGSSTTVAAGATLDFQDQLAGGGINALYGAGTVRTGTLSTTSLVVNSGNFSGNIAGNGALVKNTGGTLILSGQNAFIGGTTVNAGTLIVNGDLSFGLGQVKVNAGGTLSGNGIVGAVTLQGGNLSPGNSSGNFTTEEILWFDGQIVFDLGATPAASDLIQTGSLQGFGSTYTFAFQDAEWTTGTTYNLITFGESLIDITEFRFSNGGGFDGDFAYNGTTLQFHLTAIPEPSTSALLLTAALWAAAHRRRRLRS